MSSIIFNGRTYAGLDEMPANERQAFEQLSRMFVDRDGNGIPDFLEGDMVSNVLRSYTANNIHFNGQIYSTIRELPPEMRQKIVDAFAKLNQLGILPDDPSMILRQNAREPASVSRPFISREYSPAIQEEKGTNPIIWILAALGLLICLGLAALGILVYLQ